MKLHDLSPVPGSKKEKIRKGRGAGARRGEKTGSGTKGQKKRFKVPVYFEGGQTPLYRRLPKRGFTPLQRGPQTEVINVRSLNKFDDGETIDPRRLEEAGLISSTEHVKLLGDGSLEVSLTIEVHAASESAVQKVEDCDGTVKIISSTDTGS